MIHKVLSHGKGDPFKYLLQAEGRGVAPVVIRGDVSLCSRVICCCTFAQKYTSLVLTFAERINEDSQHQIIDEYEAIAFAGHADEFARVWVRHEEHGRTELHCVVANLHLPTGKRWAHYFDRADRPLFHSWQELTNARYGLSSPEDSRNRRLRDMPGKLPPDKRQLFNRLDSLVCHAVAGGNVRTREDITSVLRAHGYEVRESRNHLAVKPAGDAGKALRLKGKKYSADFSVDTLAQSLMPRSREEQAAMQKEREATLAAAMSRRTAYVARIRQPRRTRYAAALPQQDLSYENSTIRSDAGNSVACRPGPESAGRGDSPAILRNRNSARNAVVAIAFVGLAAGIRRFGEAIRIRVLRPNVGLPTFGFFPRGLRRIRCAFLLSHGLGRESSGSQVSHEAPTFISR